MIFLKLIKRTGVFGLLDWCSSLFFCLCLCSSLYLSLCLFPLNTSADPRSKNALKIDAGTTQVSASLSTGYHFNTKAPNQILSQGQILLPTTISKDLARFKWSKKTHQSGRLDLYVCDDANTYCDTHQIELGQKASKRAQKASAVSSYTPSAVSAVAPLVPSLDSVLAKAKKNKTLVLLDFSASWCPACVRIETEIFQTPEFKAAIQGFEFTKIDVDVFTNLPLSKKYRIKGIPTLMALDSDGNEIDRVIDFQPMPVIAKFLSAAAQDKVPLDDLAKNNIAQKSMDPLQIARRFLAADRPEPALKILETITPPPFELAQARVALAKQTYDENPLLKTKYIETLTTHLAQESGSLRSLSWRTELIGLLGKDSIKSKELLAEGRILADSWLTNETKLALALKNEDLGEYTGFERLLVATNLADLLEASGTNQEEIWIRVVEVAEHYHITPEQPGPARRFLILLTQAKQYSKAETMISAMLKLNPNDFDVRNRRLNILNAQNKHEEAKKLAETLLKEAIGRIQFRIAENLANSYLALKMDKAAKTLLDEYLSREELNLEAMANTKKRLARLRSKIE